MTDKKHHGLTIGIIFTAISLLQLFSYILPIISILPAVLFVKMAMFLKEGSNNIGKLAIILLTGTLLFSIIIFLLLIKERVEETGHFSRIAIIFFMIISYFPVHSLGASIYWGVYMDFKIDEQIQGLAAKSFPFSSFIFIPIGLLFDIVINKYSPPSTS